MVDLPGGELQARQAEVDEARARLAKTIDRLTGASGPDSLKHELMDQVHGYKDQLLEQARDYKDQLLEQAKDKGRDTVHNWTEDLKLRVRANPAGAALIGAGLAWRLYKHPPITTILLGTGAYLLMRGTPTRPSSEYRDPYRDEHPGSYVPGGVAGYGYPAGVTERLSASASDLGYRAADAGSRVRHAAEEAAARALEFAEEAGSRVSEAAEEARARLTQAAERASEFAADTYDRTRAGIEHRGAAAAGFAQRASAELSGTARSTLSRAGEVADRAQSSPIVLGTLGLVAGAALARALRATETGDRALAATSEALGRSADYVRTGVGSTVRRAADLASEAASSTTAAVRGAAESVTSRVGALTAGEDEAEPPGSPRAGPRPGPRTSPAPGREGPSALARASDRASELYETALEEAYDAGRRAAGLGRQAGEEVVDFARRYPLLAGTIGLAIGAAIGAALRSTETENRLVGSAADRLKSQAWEFAEEQFEEMTEAAQRLGADVREGVENAMSGAAPGKPQPGARFPDADPGTVIGGRSTAAAERIAPDGRPTGGVGG